MYGVASGYVEIAIEHGYFFVDLHIKKTKSGSFRSDVRPEGDFKMVTTSIAKCLNVVYRSAMSDPKDWMMAGLWASGVQKNIANWKTHPMKLWTEDNHGMIFQKEAMFEYQREHVGFMLDVSIYL